jgi:hypothetical protein
VAFGVGAVIIGAVFAFVLGVMAYTTASNVIHPGIDKTVGHAKIINDTSQLTFISLCADNDCGGTHGSPDELAPHEDDGYRNVSSHGAPNVFLVQNAAGNTLGCLPVVMPHWVPTLTVRVSARLPCRKSIDDSVQWPRSPRSG